MAAYRPQYSLCVCRLPTRPFLQEGGGGGGTETQGPTVGREQPGGAGQAQAAGGRGQWEAQVPQG